MMQSISLNTQAIMLLTAPLIVGRGSSSSDILTPGEYKKLARHLLEMGREPADFLSSDSVRLIRESSSIIDENRMQRLLDRGFLLSQAIERWQTRAIWVVSRADAHYPKLLKTRLREDSPAVLYGCGDSGLLEYGGLAVVGSRHVDEALIEQTMAIGRLAADAGITIISGGAKGVDQASMRGALEVGGNVIGVLSDNLEKISMNRENRDMLINKKLVIVTPYDPGAGFHVANAMQRNKLIYALSSAALVMSSDLKKGGTWAGASEQLNKFRFVPVYVRMTTEHSPGLDALREKGAIPWPNPQDKFEFESVFDVSLKNISSTIAAHTQLEINATSQLSPKREIVENEENGEQKLLTETEKIEIRVESETLEENQESKPADVLFNSVRRIIQQLLNVPMKEAEIAKALDVSKTQANLWLKRLIEEEMIEKIKKTGRYRMSHPTFQSLRDK